MDNYFKLIKSFEENFNKGQQDKDVFIPLFEKIARSLSKLPIKDVFVDVGRKKQIIDFNIYLENGIYMSVAQHTDIDTDLVMYSIAVNNETRDIGMKTLDELMEQMTDDKVLDQILHNKIQYIIETDKDII